MLIYTGRFQPVHNGHISLIQKLRELYPHETICVAIIKNVPIESDNEFDKSVDSMMLEERNPYSAEVVLKMMTKVIKTRFPENVVATLMPRASVSNWSTITALFDCERIWAFTENQNTVDEWEKKKFDFYTQQGDETIRVKIKKDIEGTKIREFLKKKDYDSLKRLVPAEIIEEIMALQG